MALYHVAAPVISERGRVMLEVTSTQNAEEKFKYKQDRKLSSGEMSWRCSTTGCTASVKTVGANYLITEVANDGHNHEPLPRVQLDVKALSSSAKQKALEQLSERPAEVLRSLMNEDNVKKLKTKDLKNIKRNMYNARRKCQPPLPSSCEDVHTDLSSQCLETVNVGLPTEPPLCTPRDRIDMMIEEDAHLDSTFSADLTNPSPLKTGAPASAESPNSPGQSKYVQLLSVIEEMGRDIRPTYSGSRSSTERLKRGIVQARILVRECLIETERSARQ